MRIAAFLPLAVFLCCGALFAQADDVLLDPFWDFYAENPFPPEAAGRGFTGIAGQGDVALSLMNPAAMANIYGWQIVGGYGAKTRLPWLKGIWDDVGSMYVEALPPSAYAGIGYSLNERWQLGVVYHDAYSFYFDAGQGDLVDEMGNLLGSYKSYSKARVSKISIPIAFSPSSKAVFGFALDLGKHYRYDNLMALDIKRYSEANWYSALPRLGAKAEIGRGLYLGVTVSPEWQYDYEIKSQNLLGQPLAFKCRYLSPLKIDLGLSYRPRQSPLDLYLDGRYVALSNQDNYLVDRFDFHLGADYTRDNWQVRTGFFTKRDYRQSEPSWLYILPVGNDHQYFLTCGLTRYFGFWGLSFSLMDSHLLSPGEWKTTVVNGGVSYLF
jgi:hypothetical protein